VILLLILCIPYLTTLQNTRRLMVRLSVKDKLECSGGSLTRFEVLTQHFGPEVDTARFAFLPFLRADWLEILGASNSWIAKGQSRSVYGLLFTQNLSERGEKTTKTLRIIHIIFKIKTRDLHNRDQECYPLYRGTYEYYLWF